MKINTVIIVNNLRNKILITISICIITVNVEAQDLVDFSCSFTGKPTELVKKISKLSSPVQQKKLKLLLMSGTTEEQYLSILLYEVLINKNRIRITKSENDKILELYKSKEMVKVCSGCTLFLKYPMDELLQGKYIGNQARKWARKMLDN